MGIDRLAIIKYAIYGAIAIDPIIQGMPTRCHLCFQKKKALCLDKDAIPKYPEIKNIIGIINTSAHTTKTVAAHVFSSLRGL